ncbi:solute carrier organic anion transporter family member 1A2 isoform X2 [Desmodus rotundus]|uniref:solute carrier organic anion transporter family member 1A2 isoform X2 n=1 Tax=Desmodus rotundus TaxID=9430 RepID=UPI001E1BF3CD|nr:solute carrier organic anion transporter family member 1A2 isoform X2 [Desmodus rotundus]
MGETEKIETRRIRCFSKFKIFLLAITCAFIAKTLSGSYMNSMLTQIERQFNVPTSLVGFINGSFEIGNLFLIIFVSYFGTKLHRPIMIGVGCVVMGLGCFLQSLPHFLMGRYEYESTVSGNLSSNNFLCTENGTQIFRPTEDPSECVKEVKSLMWVYVLVGNVIRGIGETPIMPLGISYVEDFAKSENSPLYIGFIETGAIIGPLFGLLLASFSASVYVDMGSVNTDFLPFMKILFCNPIYMLFILVSVIQFNAFINMMVFMPKYLEQQYGKSTSDAVFLIGIYNLPPICFGYIFGGLIMKKFKITIKQAAHVAFWLSFIDYLLYFLCFLMICDHSPVAGLTTSYKGTQQDPHVGNAILADCNADCHCPTKTWDPVCGSNGLSYMSACLAGCETFVGTGLKMVFQNCSCIQTSGNSSAVLGLCGRGPDCSMMLQYFLILSSVSSFIYSLSAIPGYMVLLRCIKPEQKSLGVGLHTFSTRVFAGIPAPIYFGALMDSTCLHWPTFKCGESGACRMYDSTTFRYLYLGLPIALRGLSFVPALLILIILRRYHLPGDNPSSGTGPGEAKVTGKENECQEMDQISKVLNNDELKTKL